MNEIQVILTVSVATLAVLIGILVNNSRFTDLNSRFTELRSYLDKRLNDQRDLMRAGTGKLEQMLTIMMGKIDEIDTRVARIEERR
ncbi:MAG: hypothetical protein ACR2NN_13020 [Bryobacteraceae bacterium]